MVLIAEPVWNKLQNNPLDKTEFNQNLPNTHALQWHQAKWLPDWYDSIKC